MGDFLEITPKLQPKKEIIDKLDVIKSKTSASWKTMLRGWAEKSWTWRKYLQKTYLTKDCYPKYKKNS